MFWRDEGLQRRWRQNQIISTNGEYEKVKQISWQSMPSSKWIDNTHKSIFPNIFISLFSLNYLSLYTKKKSSGFTNTMHNDHHQIRLDEGMPWEFNNCHSLLQGFDGEEFLKCLKHLISIEREWVPYSNKCSLYIRPTLIGIQVRLAVTALGLHFFGQYKLSFAHQLID